MNPSVDLELRQESAQDGLLCLTSRTLQMFRLHFNFGLGPTPDFLLALA